MLPLFEVQQSNLLRDIPGILSGKVNWPNDTIRLENGQVKRIRVSNSCQKSTAEKNKNLSVGMNKIPATPLVPTAEIAVQVDFIQEKSNFLDCATQTCSETHEIEVQTDFILPPQPQIITKVIEIEKEPILLR